MKVARNATGGLAGGPGLSEFQLSVPVAVLDETERIEPTSDASEHTDQKQTSPDVRGLCRVRSGAEESRTPDLIIANDALYQLSYRPVAAIRGEGV